jgi:tRNA(fMet)-specific endonuclease VapC
VYLLDTCVISELVAQRPNGAVLAWLEAADEHQLYLSAITIGEIQRGIARLPQTDRRQQLSEWLGDALLGRFKGRVLSLDAAVMLTWGTLVAELEGAGRPLPAMDSLIAALARHHDLAVVTRNEKDFMGTGLTIVNPWE